MMADERKTGSGTIYHKLYKSYLQLVRYLAHRADAFTHTSYNLSALALGFTSDNGPSEQVRDEQTGSIYTNDDDDDDDDDDGRTGDELVLPMSTDAIAVEGVLLSFYSNAPFPI